MGFFIRHRSRYGPGDDEVRKCDVVEWPESSQEFIAYARHNWGAEWLKDLFPSPDEFNFGKV